MISHWRKTARTFDDQRVGPSGRRWSRHRGARATRHSANNRAASVTTTVAPKAHGATGGSRKYSGASRVDINVDNG